MGQKTVTLQLPDAFYDSAQEAAEAAGRSVETLLLESIDLMFHRLSPSDDVDRTLADMRTYSDVQLWATVYRQLPWTQSLRLRELSAQGKQGH